MDKRVLLVFFVLVFLIFINSIPFVLAGTGDCEGILYSESICSGNKVVEEVGGIIHDDCTIRSCCDGPQKLCQSKCISEGTSARCTKDESNCETGGLCDPGWGYGCGERTCTDAAWGCDAYCSNTDESCGCAEGSCMDCTLNGKICEDGQCVSIGENDIVCDNDGVIIRPGLKSNIQNKDCVITSDKQVSGGHTYFIRHLTLDGGTIEVLQNPNAASSSEGGAGGDGGTHCDDGGKGGAGGGLIKKGKKGPWTTCVEPGNGGDAGSTITIATSKITINTETYQGTKYAIKAVGGPGERGGNPGCDCGGHQGGSGGGGGGGGGVVKIYSSDITSIQLTNPSSFADVSGGAGGRGGDGEDCNSCAKTGSGGGGGGGGNGGSTILYYRRIIYPLSLSQIIVDTDSGAGGQYGHVRGEPGTGKGKSGSSGNEGTYSYSNQFDAWEELQIRETNCNDGYDNDLDGNTDCDDGDCFTYVICTGQSKQACEAVEGEWEPRVESNKCCGDENFNKDFEVGEVGEEPPGWRVSCESDAECYITDTDDCDPALSGEKCLFMGGGSSGIENLKMVNISVGVDTNTDYRISIYAKGFGSNKCLWNGNQNALVWYGTPGNWQPNPSGFGDPPPTKWQLGGKTWNSGDDTQLTIKILVCPEVDFYFDNISVIPFVSAGDEGYIKNLETDDGYMCLYESLPEGWEWLMASTEYFDIKTTKIDNIDAISNSEQWYYCDATEGGTLGDGTTWGGIPIPNFATFEHPSPAGGGFCPYPAPDGWACTAENAEQHGEACCQADTYDPGSPQQCVPCYDANGNEIDFPPEPPEGEGDLIPKDECLYGECYGEEIPSDPDTPCEELGGEYCYDDDFCVDGVYTKSKESNRCCYGGHCESPDPDQTCEAQGGVLCFEQEYCGPPGEEITASNTYEEGFGPCCSKAEGCKPIDGYLYDINVNDTFICYQEHGKDIMGECCFSSLCMNKGLFKQSEHSSYSLNIFTTGAPLHTLQNFDKFDDEWRYLTDYVFRVENLQPEAFIRIPREDYLVFTKVGKQDWREFDYLEFDIRFTQPIEKILLSDKDDNNVWEDDLSKYTTTSFQGNAWHHIKVNLNQINADLSNIKRIRLQNGELTSSVWLDNFILTSEEEELDIRYCSAEFGDWIKDLDPIEEVDPSDINTWGPYKFACIAQMSFGWTGTKCCGDDNLVSINEENKEFYEDMSAGCWGGLTIPSDKTVSEIYGAPSEYPNVLFFDEAFQGCNDEEEHGAEEFGTVDPLPNEYCTVLGSHYCAPSDNWLTEIPGVGPVSGVGNLGMSEAPPETPESVPFLPEKPDDYVEAGCCPEDFCWNGTICMDSALWEDNPQYPPIFYQFAPPGWDGTGYRCIGGEWNLSYLKYDWDYTVFGYCPDNSQCLLQTYECVDSDYSEEQHYCDDGIWVSRTHMLAQQLISFSNENYRDDFTLYCDEYEFVLNDVETNLNYLKGELCNPGLMQYYSCFGCPDEGNTYCDGRHDENCLDDQENTIGRCCEEQCFIGKSSCPADIYAECVSDFCALKYKTGGKYHVLAGTSLNQPVNAEYNSILELLVGDKDYCDNALPEEEYTPCKDKDVWYNPTTNTVIFSTEEIPLKPTTWYRQFFNFIKRIIMNILGREEANIDLIDFSKLYISKQRDRMIVGTEAKEFKSKAKERELFNNDFETGEVGEEPPDWDLINCDEPDAECYITDECDPVSGEKCLFMGGGLENVKRVNITLSVKPNTTYRTGVYAKGGGGEKCLWNAGDPPVPTRTALVWYGAPGNWANPSGFVFHEEWQPSGKTWDSKDSTRLEIIIVVCPENDFYFDYVTVEPPVLGIVGGGREIDFSEIFDFEMEETYTINYTGFSADICEAVGESGFPIEKNCTQKGDSQLITIKLIDQSKPEYVLEYWKDLTAATRVPLRPPAKRQEKHD